MTGSPAQRPARRSAVVRYQQSVARLTPRYLAPTHLAMYLPVCPSAFIRFAVVMCSVSSMRWLVAGAGDTTNHAESDAPSDRCRYTVARETPSIFAMSVAVMPLSGAGGL